MKKATQCAAFMTRVLLFRGTPSNKPPTVIRILTECFWMSAEPEGQYFYTAILQKAATIQKWSGQRESNPLHQLGRLR